RTAPSPQSPRTAAPAAARIISRSTLSRPRLSSATAVRAAIVPPATYERAYSTSEPEPGPRPQPASADPAQRAVATAEWSGGASPTAPTWAGDCDTGPASRRSDSCSNRVTSG